ncbi:MAG: hypothetical protein K1X94_18000 [Sandaracinaceae bacterium]|nr:hypothetical protein [Sandaracinaceae bacterium]
MSSRAHTAALVFLATLAAATPALAQRQAHDTERAPVAMGLPEHREPSRLRLDVTQGFGWLEQANARHDRIGMRFQLGARLVFDGENGAYLDLGLHTFFGSGTSSSFDPNTLALDLGAPFRSDLLLTAEAGYLHRFLLDGDDGHGVGLDLGLGATAILIGAQISPGAHVSVSVDRRFGGFLIGGEARGRLLAQMSSGSAAALYDYQLLLRLGFGFGG